MRNLLFLSLIVFCTCFTKIKLFAQNTGIGTTTPSPNALLHLENGILDLGLLLPNVDISGFTPLVTDEGMMVYDSVLDQIYAWDGAAWQTVGGPTTLQSAYDGGQTLTLSSGDIDIVSSAANSILYLDDANERVGIGTSSPTAQFETTQEIVVNGIEIGRGLNNDNRSTGVGLRTLDVTGLAAANTAFGYEAGWQITSGTDNVAVGSQALTQNTTGSTNTAVGGFALLNNVNGSGNTAIGALADVSAPGLVNATAIGTNTTVSQNNSLILGNNANVGIGTSTPANKLEVIGDAAKFDSVIIANNAQAGYILTAADASGAASWQPTTGGTAWDITGNTGTIDGVNFIGTSDAIPINFRVNNVISGRIDQAGPTLLGFQAGQLNTAVQSTAFGNRALSQNIAGIDNTAFGFNALRLNTASSNVALGTNALASNTTGTQNTAIGPDALGSNNIGDNNTAVGERALVNNSDGSSNTAVGLTALFSNVSGNRNSALGWDALFTNTGTDNVGIGYRAGFNNTTGSANVFIGENADASAGNLTNATAIGSGAVVGASNSLVLGNNANVGIGTSTPNAPLQLATALANRKIVLFEGANNDHQFFGFGVNGAALRYQVNGTFASHIFYASVNTTSSDELMRIVGDGNVGIGVAAPLERLHISSAAGSTGLVVTNDFLGTTATDGLLIGISGSNAATINNRENGSLFLGTNGLPNINQLVLDPSGNVGINITPPTERLHINGNLRFSGALMPNNLPGSAGDILISGGPGAPPTWGTGTGFSTAGEGLTGTGSTIDLGGIVNLSETFFDGPNDMLFRMASSNSALNTKVGMKFLMFDGTISDQWEVIARKTDAIVNSGQSNFVINKQFSTAGGQLDAFTIDGDNSNVIINNSKTSAGAFGNFVVANGNVGIGEFSPNILPNPGLGAGSRVIHLSSPGSPFYVIEKTDATTAKWGLTIGSNGNFYTQNIDGGGLNVFGIEQGAIADQLYLQSGGNVGIGTSSPSYTLDINGGPGLRIEPQTGGENFITFVNSNDGNTAWGINDGWTVNRDFRIYRYDNTGTFQDQPFTIENATGNVGLGVGAPNDRLNVNGSIRLNDNDLYFRPGNDQNHGLGWYYTGKQFGTFQPDGPVLYGNLGGGLGRTQFGTNSIQLAWDGSGVTVFGIFNNLSDERVKENVSDIEYGLKEVMELKPIKYDWKEGHGEGTSLGFIAQEVLKVAPEIVKIPKDSSELYSMSYIEIIPILVKSIQEQQELIHLQKIEIEDLQARNSQSENTDKMLEEKLNTMQAQINRLHTILTSEAKR